MNNLDKRILEITKVYDNNGETYDRYTVFTPDGAVYGMSDGGEGFNQYIGDYTEVEMGEHLGTKLDSVPESIKSAVLNRMVDSQFVDLFQYFELMPENVSAIFDMYYEMSGGDWDYDNLSKLQEELKELGYTFDYGLDAEPYGLRPIELSLNQLKDFEEYKNGGGVKYPTELKVGSVLEGVGFPMLKGIDGGNYYTIVEMDNYSATLVKSDKNGNKKGSKKVRHYLSSIEGGIKTASRGDNNGILVVKYSKGGGVGYKQVIEFEYKGKNHKFSFVPDEPDMWTSFESHGLVFDVHYDEDYNEIVVYEVIDNEAQLEKSVYSKRIMKKGGGVNSYNLDNEINQLYKKSGFINSDFNWKLKLLEMLQDQSIEAYNIYQKLSKEQKGDVLQQQFEIDNDMGSYGDEDIKTSKQNLKIILEDAKNGKKYAKGGGIGDYKITLKSWDALVYEDDYNEGEGEQVNSFSERVNKSFSNTEDFFKYINDNVLYYNMNKEYFSIMDDGRIVTSLLVDEDNSAASKSEIGEWEKGNKKLYSANYNFYVTLTKEKTPTANELSELLGIGVYKQGGSIKGHYNSGRSWHLDRQNHNKSEDWEKPMRKRKKRYAIGGGVDLQDKIIDGDLVKFKDDAENIFNEKGYYWKWYLNEKLKNKEVFKVTGIRNDGDSIIKFLGDTGIYDDDRTRIGSIPLSIHAPLDSLQKVSNNKMAEGGGINSGRDNLFKSQEPHEQKYKRKREWKEYKKEGWFGDWFRDGGSMDDYTKSLGMVRVKFADPKYNYETNVSGSITEEQARNYFVGKMFDVGTYPNENMQKVIDIDFYPKGTYELGGNIGNEEEMVKSNLYNGEISCEKLTEIIGCKPNYPYQIVGAIKLEKCYLRPYYKLV